MEMAGFSTVDAGWMGAVHDGVIPALLVEARENIACLMFPNQLVVKTDWFG